MKKEIDKQNHIPCTCLWIRTHYDLSAHMDGHEFF